MTIDYLTRLERSAAVDEILRAERSQRKRDYEKFAGLCRETYGARLPDDRKSPIETYACL